MDALKTFIIYSHEDIKFRKGLGKYLNHLVRLNKIDLWSDTEIKPGEAWNDVIQKNLDEADLILMLISVDFYNSEYIHKIELERAKARREKGDAILVPIVVRTCPSSYDILQDFQALPANLKPIDRWDNIDDAYSHVANEIEVLIENMTRQKREIAIEKSNQERLQAEQETQKAMKLAEMRKKEHELARVAQKKAEKEMEDLEIRRINAEAMRARAEEKAQEEETLKEKEKEEKDEIKQNLVETRKQRRNARIALAAVCALSIVGFSQFLALKSQSTELKHQYAASAVGVYDKNARIAILENDLDEAQSKLQGVSDSLRHIKIDILESSIVFFQNVDNHPKKVYPKEVAQVYLLALGIDSCNSAETISDHLNTIRPNTSINK